MNRVVVLGSTGTIGSQALEVIRNLGEGFQVVGLSARANYHLLWEQTRTYRPRYLYYHPGVEAQGLSLKDVQYILPEEMVAAPDVDIVVVASAGLAAGLGPTLGAIKAGKKVVLANTEVMVAAGRIVMEEVRKRGVHLHLVESEPAALLRCIKGETSKPYRMVITSSWGPYRAAALGRLATVTKRDILGYPGRRLSQKRSIDAATLMSKGFQTIQVHHYFDIPVDKIHVVVHPQDVVRSLVQFADGSIKTLFGSPDPRFWIRYALLNGSMENGLSIPSIELENIRELGFAPLEEGSFPCYQIAREAGMRGGTFPAVLNAADEAAIGLFLTNQIGFREIVKVIRAAVERHQGVSNPSIEDIYTADAWAREFVSRQVPE